MSLEGFDGLEIHDVGPIDRVQRDVIPAAGSGEPTKSGTWTMRSGDQLGGQTGHWSDLVGTKKGQEIHAEQRGRTPDGRTTILKIRYFDIQPNHFSWVADRSEDGGVTWAREYVRIEATRHVATPAGQ